MEHYEAAEGTLHTHDQGPVRLRRMVDHNWQDVTVLSTTSWDVRRWLRVRHRLWGLAGPVPRQGEVVANAFRTDCFEISAYVSGGTGVVAGLAVGLGVGSLTGPGGLVAGVKAGAGSAVFVGGILMGTCKFVADTVQDDTELDVSGGERRRNLKRQRGRGPDLAKTGHRRQPGGRRRNPETTSVTKRWEETEQAATRWSAPKKARWIAGLTSATSAAAPPPGDRGVRHLRGCGVRSRWDAVTRLVR